MFLSCDPTGCQKDILFIFDRTIADLFAKYHDASALLSPLAMAIGLD
jgi:hypothetical protein